MLVAVGYRFDVPESGGARYPRAGFPNGAILLAKKNEAIYIYISYINATH